MSPAIVQWGEASAWFSDARDADAFASAMRRGPDTVTVRVVAFTPAECDAAIERVEELEAEIAETDTTVQSALEALRKARP